MYNISEDLIFNCLDFHSQYDDLKLPPPQQQTPQVSIFHHTSTDPLSTYFQDQKAKIQMLDPTSHIPLESNPEPVDRHLQEKSLEINKECGVREIRQIFCSADKHVERSKLLKGQPYETQNIGKHLRSITVSYLTLLSKARILDLEQEVALNAFQSSNGSFSDFSQLFSIESLRSKCQAFFSSKDFMWSILSLTRMSFESRLIMIKYSQRLRKIAYRKTLSWKMEGN